MVVEVLVGVVQAFGVNQSDVRRELGIREAEELSYLREFMLMQCGLAGGMEALGLRTCEERLNHHHHLHHRNYSKRAGHLFR